MEKHKTKIIVAAVIVIALAGAWLLGEPPQINIPDDASHAVAAVESGLASGAGADGNSTNPAAAAEPLHGAAAGANDNSQPQDPQTSSREPFVSSSEQTNLQGTYYEASNSTGRSGTEQDRQDSSEPSEAAGESEIPYASPADLELGTYSDSVASAEPNTSAEPGVPGAPNAPDTPDTPGETATSAHQEPTENPSDPITPDSPATPGNVTTPDVPASETQIAGGEHPEMREPVEPEDMIAGDGSFTVTLSVRAHMILYNMHLLHIDKHELVPADGWIFPPTQVTAYEGESVFNVLQREMRRNRIHMSSRFTPVFNSAYVEAINNLFEFDVGPLSGWMYSVNGWFPNFGASRYLLSPGDVIEWVYTVDLGRDLGVGWLTGTQEDE